MDPENTATTPETNEQPAAAATPEAPKPSAPAEPTKAIWDDPATAQAEIERLRRENAKDRTNAKAQAAEEAQKALAQTIGKALGIVEDEQIDPAKLTESLTAAQTEAKRAQVALAVYQNAGTTADPAALLDSTSFLKTLADIDPTDDAAIKAAIESAVEFNPRLGAAPAITPPAPNPAQGSSASGAPDMAARIAEAKRQGDWQTVVALENQKLTTHQRG